MTIHEDLLAGKYTRIGILAYNIGSKSAKELKEELHKRYPDKRTRIIKPDGNFRGGRSALVLGWGYSGDIHNETINASTLLNNPYFVGLASNKLHTFMTLQRSNVLTPAYATKPDEAARWLQDGAKVVARFKLNGHSGEGIVIADNAGTVYADENYKNKNFFSAKLYTKYVKKKDEFRVFVFGDTVGWCYHKKLAHDAPEGTRQHMVRNHSTGWNFAQIEDKDVPAAVKNMAVQAAQALRLQYCAVDVGWNATNKAAYVFEVNTAPGISGGSVPRFVDNLVGVQL